MWLFLLFVLILAIIIFVPIPLIFELEYVDNIFNLYIYKKLIFSTNKKIKKEKQKSHKVKQKKEKEPKSKVISKYFDIKAIISSLYTNPYKPKLKVWLDFKYSLDDAANTALLYGVLQNTLATVFNLLNAFLKLQVKEFKIIPLFNNTTGFFLKIKGIFYINLAKIIYILFLYFNKIRKKNN